MCNRHYAATKVCHSRRSVTPIPDIHRALFPNMKENCSKRSSRPSLEDDLKKNSLVRAKGGGKENLGLSDRKFSSSSRLISHARHGSSTTDGGLKYSSNKIFRFSSNRVPLSPKPTTQPRLPLISVQCDDDVFEDSNFAVLPPSSSKLLLTPSTAHTPVFRFNSSTSFQAFNCIPSPSIAEGLCCNTPNRLKLEKEGLGPEKLVLGKGAYGTVVLGQWKGKKVAVKVMQREDEGKKNARRRQSIESELQAMELDHQNIVKIYGVHAADDRHAVIIMEYVGSRNLHRLLVEQTEKDLETSWLLVAAKQIASALAHCHSRGIIHMDIKPANVLVTRQGVCKVGDFGCSVSTSCSMQRIDHCLVGTPGYQSPEFLRGGIPSPACDIFSLGILMWQLDARLIPFAGQHPHTKMFRVVSTGARPEIPSSCNANIKSHSYTCLYQACWNTNIVQRPSASKVVASLEVIMKSASISKSLLKVRAFR